MAGQRVLIKHVESTDIDSIGYNRDTKTLGVKFKEKVRHGQIVPPTIYLFPDVGWETFREFCASPSAGQFFARHIKGMKFKKVQ